MAIFKCKICGGTLEFSEGSSVCECQYCGTRQTLPQISNEHSTTLYERADHFRRNNDFDKAISIYEQILNENNTDAEAYWSLVLCRYGVEYVEDPKSNKRIATVNRMQYTSVLADEDYKSAIKYADPAQKEIYETEAKEIDTIQKGILAISQKEEPFDVFICYKETDNSGRRTPDSVLANELYHQLDNEGFKVFFSRITLEDKLGTAYEPYIFAALNSAKVMVVIGTKPEYFNAVWVRNEWSRFLALIKNGANKVLIPAYRDMDPYDLPEEFSHLQAQDMSKLGFMQDLIRGIEKLTGASKPKQVKEQPVQSGANTAPLLRRAFLFLEDGDWASADEYCEKVLDLDPESGEAYLGKMMSELKIRRRELLPEQEERFDNNPQYKKVLRFGSTQLQEELKSATKAINERAERKRLSIAYKKAASLFASAKAKEDYLDAAEAFDAIGDFEDAKERAKACREKYDEVYYGGLYAAAVAAMNYAKTVGDFKKAISKFEKIREYKDSDQQIALCQQKIEQINEATLAVDIAKQNRAQARAEAIQAGASAIKEKLPLIKKIAFVVVPVLVIAIVASLILPKIDFSKLQKPDSSISNDLPGDNTTESSSSTETSETETSETETSETETSETETGETESTEIGTTENQQPSTQTPTPQQPSTQTVTHNDGCPFANGANADTLSKEKGVPESCWNDGARYCHTNYEYFSDYYYRYSYFYNITGELIGLQASKCNLSHYLMEGIHYDGAGNIEERYEHKYDSAGNCIAQVSIIYDGTGNITHHSERIFDSAGNYIEDISYDGAGNITGRTEYIYDSAGNLIEKLSYDGAGNITGRTEYKYDSAGNRIEDIFYDGAGNITGRIEYISIHDSTGNWTQYISYYDGAGNITGRTEYKYDSAGNIIEQLSYDGAGNITGRTEFI